MPDIGTYGDSVRVWLTGAAADQANQADDALSLGGYRSNTRLNSFSISRTNPVAGIRIDHASGANGAGVGALSATTANTLTWTAPGGTAGAEVTISNGETKVVPDATGSKYLVVTRISASGMSGSESVRLRPVVNNAIGGTNLGPGVYDKYKAVMIEFAQAVTSVSIINTGISSNDEYIYGEFAVEEPVGGALTVCADELTPPSGIVFGYGASVSLGNMSAGALRGLWIRTYETAVPGYNGAASYLLRQFQIQFTVSGVTYTQSLLGCLHAEGHETTSWTSKTMPCPRYETYVGVDAYPAVGETVPHGATNIPDAMSATSPYSIALAPGHTYRLVTQYRNKFGMASGIRRIETIRIDAEGVEELTPPHAPFDMAAAPAVSGGVHVRAAYYPGSETDPENIATHWKIYVESDGSTADPSTTTPISVAMTTSTTRAILDRVIACAALEGAPISVLIRTERQDAELGNVESINTETLAATAAWFGPVRALPQAHFLTAYGAALAPPSPPDTAVTVSASPSIYWRVLGGESRLYADGALVVSFWKDSGPSGESGMYSVMGIVPYTPESADDPDDDYDLSEWTTGNKVFYLNVGSVRAMKIDVTNGTIGLGAGPYPDAPSSTRAGVPFWRKYQASCIQVWDLYAHDYVTIASLDSDGTLHMLEGSFGKNTEEECLRG